MVCVLTWVSLTQLSLVFAQQSIPLYPPAPTSPTSPPSPKPPTTGQGNTLAPMPNLPLGSPLGANAAEGFQVCQGTTDNPQTHNQLDQLLERALEDPENPFIHYNLGVQYFRQQDWEKARRSFGVALGLTDQEPLQAKINYNLGLVNLCEQQYADAVRSFRQSLLQQPEDQDTQHNLSLAQEKYLMQKMMQQHQQQGDPNSDSESSEGDEQQTAQGDQSQQQQGDQQQASQGQQDEPSAQQQMAENQGDESQQQSNPDQANPGQQEASKQADEQQQSEAMAGDQTEEGQSEEDQQSVAQSGADEDTDEQDLQALLNQQQAQRLIESVQENRRAIIQRYLQNKHGDKRQPEKNW